MSQFLLVCLQQKISIVQKKRLDIIANKIIPDNLIPNPSLEVGDDSLRINVLNPNSTINLKKKGICFGKMINETQEWFEVSGDVPHDGNYSIIRYDDDTLQIIGDILGYRSIWYYQDQDVFIASSSQRAIILYLGEFQPNQEVYKWMLSSGSLGPDLSWDSRIKKLKPDSALSLNRNKWTISYNINEFIIQPVERKLEKLEDTFKKILEDVFQNYNFDTSSWTLPLSGGYDSRAILQFLGEKKSKGFKSITWGTHNSLYNKQSDAYVAELVAQKFETNHSFLEVDPDTENIANVIKRFVCACEGRIDKISGYVDGMKLWNKLHKSGIKGIIRGDQALGAHEVQSPNEVYNDVGFTVLEDFSNTRKISKLLGDYIQKRPTYLTQQVSESLQTWNERLYQIYRVPTLVSALNSIKLNYVEVISPFFTRSIINFIRQLPDDARTNKKLFMAITNKFNTDIPYASTNAHINLKSWLRQEKTMNVILEQFYYGKSSKDVFPKSYIDYIANKNNSNFLINQINKVRNKLQGKNTVLDFNRIAFRSLIITKMYDIIKEDLSFMKKIEVQ